MEQFDVFSRLGVALAIGVLVGIERGWHQREAEEGSRVAGIRSFALLGLLGGVIGVVGAEQGAAFLGLAVLGVSGLVVAAHLVRARHGGDLGSTTEIAALLVFALGLLAARGELAVAAAGGVVTATLLGLKPELHAWLTRLERLELIAAFKLLLISLVLLPILPDRGYGPGAALNPAELWLVVVMVAAISFVGYFAIKLAGARLGSLLTGLFGGIASSTALTVSFARLGRADPNLQGALAAGVAVGAATMLLRLLLIVLLLNDAVGLQLAGPLVPAALVGYAAALWLWRRRAGLPAGQAARLANPFEIGVAIKFALLLALIMLASELVRGWLGISGLYGLAALSGLLDVDAIAISVARMADLAATAAMRAIALAAMVNTLVKAVLVAVLCGGAMARQVAVAVVAMALAGLAAAALA